MVKRHALQNAERETSHWHAVGVRAVGGGGFVAEIAAKMPFLVLVAFVLKLVSAVEAVQTLDFVDARKVTGSEATRENQ